MKKITKLATLILSVIMLAISMTACSLFSNQPDNSGGGGNEGVSTPNTQTITVYNGENHVTYTATLGEVAKIDVFTKPGYYFVGAYDTAEGGTKYFDSTGNSTMVWGAGNPDTYYARFASVLECSYKDTLREDGGIWFTFTLDEEIMSAINGNLDHKLNVNISFEAACEETWELRKAYITNNKSGGTNHICFDEAIQLPNNAMYKSFNYSFEIKAREFKNGNVYFYIYNSTIVSVKDYYVKNITLDIEFASE